jgi:hypothetical protein
MTGKDTRNLNITVISVKNKLFFEMRESISHGGRSLQSTAFSNHFSPESIKWRLATYLMRIGGGGDRKALELAP